MRPICAALLATTIMTPAVQAAPVDLIATFNVTGFSFAPEETPQQASDLTGGNDNPFDNDFSGGFMSPQTGNGPEDTNYVDEAAERELREQTFVQGLPYGGAQWNGVDNAEAGVPIYQPGENDPYAGDDFLNNWVLPENLWEFDEVTARFVLDSDDFNFANVSENINNDLVDENFNLLDSNVNTLFNTDALGSLFLTNSGEGLLLRNTAAVALNSTGATDDNGNLLQENDFLVIAGIEGGDGPGDPSIGLFATVFVGDSNWFETVFEDPDGNLLASLTDPAYELTSELFVEERRWGVDDNGFFVPLGTLAIGGEGTGLTSETSGSSEQSALLPNAAPTAEGGFAFEVAIQELINEEGIVWIDPDIATGYVYQATQTIEGVEQNAVFTKVQAPSLASVNDADGYILTVTHIVDQDGNLVELPDDGTRPTYDIGPGILVEFNERVGIFELTGISESLMLDPENGLVFQTGLAFENTAGLFNITQTPITIFVPDEADQVSAVPLPMPALMLLTGLGGLAALRRRRRT